MRFVLRVQGGLTRELAAHIARRSEAKGGQAVDCWVSVEGPHGALRPRLVKAFSTDDYFVFVQARLQQQQTSTRFSSLLADQVGPSVFDVSRSATHAAAPLSGITHPLSVAADVCRRAAAGEAVVTSKIKLVWALHRLGAYRALPRGRVKLIICHTRASRLGPGDARGDAKLG